MPVYSVFFIRLIINVLTFVVRIVYLKYKIGLSVEAYLRKVVAIVFVISLLSLPLPLFVSIYLEGWYGFILSSSLSIVIVLSLIYWIGLNDFERDFIKRLIFRIIRRNI